MAPRIKKSCWVSVLVSTYFGDSLKRNEQHFDLHLQVYDAVIMLFLILFNLKVKTPLR